MTLKTQILDAVAANLRDFGYPDAKADNVTTVKLFAMFARDQIAELTDKYPGNAEVAEAVSALLAEVDATIGAA